MKKGSFVITLILSIILLMPSAASADVGPKPSLEIIVINAPSGEYYLDLLIDYDGDHLYSYIKKETIAFPEMLETLNNYRVDGWRPALVTGTRVPLNGKLVGEKNGDTMLHRFSYVGVPDKFKVIVVTADQHVTVSHNVVIRKAFNSTVYFNYETGELTESPFTWAYLKQFLATCSATLLIEGLILILFRFSLKANWKPLLGVNILTQILLTIVIFRTMYSSGSFAAFLLYIPFEIVILVIESFLFTKFLTQHSSRRRKLFVITANLASFALGICVMIYYPLIIELLKS